MNTSQSSEADARRVIRVVERLVADSDDIEAICEKARRAAASAPDELHRERRAVRYIIRHYSNLTALGGGASGLPGLLPVVGSVFSVFGAGALDAVLALKFELEMALALSSLAGFDIEEPKERKFAFLLACASLADAYAADKEPTLAQVVDIAMGEFSTREMSKSLIKMMARVIVMMTAKRMTRFVPFVSLAVGASVNKVMSAHTGFECWMALKRRRDAKKA